MQRLTELRQGQGLHMIFEVWRLLIYIALGEAAQSSAMVMGPRLKRKYSNPIPILPINELARSFKVSVFLTL